MVRIFLMLTFLMVFSSCKGRPTNNIDNLVAFAKVYGYVKYFHPSDEALSINWDAFASYGAEIVQDCSNDRELVETLYDLFLPIAPSIVFSTPDEGNERINAGFVPSDSSGFVQVFWQHEGIDLDMLNPSKVYKSFRAILKNGVLQDSLFALKPNIDASISEELKKKVSISLPLVLYKDSIGTYPRVNEKAFKRLKRNLSRHKTDFREQAARFGNVIIVYNVLQHFYPYHDVFNVDWEAELESALARSVIDKNLEEHFITLEKMTASLKDGHMRVYSKDLSKTYLPSIAWDWVEDKLIITNLLDDYPGLTIGDEVTQINNVEARAYFKEITSRISAATDGYLKYVGQYKCLFGEEGSEIVLTINGREVSLTRDMKFSRSIPAFQVNDYTHKSFEEGIEYLNLNNISMGEIVLLMPQLEESEAIICDLRGYPNANHGFINHLLLKEDTVTNWMQVPQIIYPNHQAPYEFRMYNWTNMMKPVFPYLGDKKIVFITDGRAISYAESFLGFIEGYDLATIVGEPTAGTNGNVNKFNLPGGISITWTGMKVIKHDGTPLHGVGIKPDVVVHKSIKGVKEGRDEQLEAAIQIAKERS